MILTQTIKNKLNFQTGDFDLEDINCLAPLLAFEPITLSFFDEVSKRILSSSDARAYPDLASFAFGCRIRNLEKIKKESKTGSGFLSGRGISLHFTPSNVPLNFAYSLFSALLAGNICLIRMSSKDFPQANVLNRVFRELLSEERFERLRARIAIFKYAHDPEVTRYLTELCDIRVIWGSDETIHELRTFSLQAKAYDITFPDRHSICVIDAENYLKSSNAYAVALRFYNDTLFFDQNACTSPRLLYWVGEETTVQQAQDRFWGAFEQISQEKGYSNQNNMIVDKMVAACSAAIELEGCVVRHREHIACRISVEQLPIDIERYSASGGFFIEYSAENLDALPSLCRRKLQTITYEGLAATDLLAVLNQGAVLGVDRIVPIGKGSDFTLIWDGYDLIRQMAKSMSVI
ncbi:acyl-CoA reductase [Vibrio splendidus]